MYILAKDFATQLLSNIHNMWLNFTRGYVYVKKSLKVIENIRPTI